MATIGPKKDGGPNIEFFQSPESLTQFDQIRVWLQKNCKKVMKRTNSIPNSNPIPINLFISLLFTTWIMQAASVCSHSFVWPVQSKHLGTFLL